jgi:histidinol phosphatase-like enzyme
MIGDARADLEAAEANQIQFMLRRHETNAKVFVGYTGPSVKEFNAL